MDEERRTTWSLPIQNFNFVPSFCTFLSNLNPLTYKSGQCKDSISYQNTDATNNKSGLINIAIVVVVVVVVAVVIIMIIAIINDSNKILIIQ